MPSISIQLVCFDLGGVLIRLCDSWDHAFQRAGIDQCEPKKGFHHHRQFDEATHQFERGEIDQTDWAERLTDLTGLGGHQILAILQAWLVEPYPGVDTLLDKLQSTTVRTACLSNTNHTHWHQMTSQGPALLPLHRLHHRFASPFIGHRKPEAPIYQHVQDKTGIPPHAILFFDDLPENIQAARQQGWCAHTIDPLHDPIAQVTDHLQQLGVLP